MRSDYALYVVAVICFAIAIYAYAAPLTGITDLYLYTLAVLGIIFIGLGYMARPKKPMLATIKPPLSPAELSPEPETPSETEQSKTPTKKRARKKRTTRRRKRKT